MVKVVARTWDLWMGLFGCRGDKGTVELTNHRARGIFLGLGLYMRNLSMSTYTWQIFRVS